MKKLLNKRRKRIILFTFILVYLSIRISLLMEGICECDIVNSITEIVDSALQINQED